jgi:hypothetical protein
MAAAIEYEAVTLRRDRGRPPSRYEAVTLRAAIEYEAVTLRAAIEGDRRAGTRP